MEIIMFKNVFITLSLLLVIGLYQHNAAAAAAQQEEIQLAPNDGRPFWLRLNEAGKAAARLSVLRIMYQQIVVAQPPVEAVVAAFNALNLRDNNNEPVAGGGGDIIVALLINTVIGNLMRERQLNQEGAEQFVLRGMRNLERLQGMQLG